MARRSSKNEKKSKSKQTRRTTKKATSRGSASRGGQGGRGKAGAFRSSRPDDSHANPRVITGRILINPAGFGFVDHDGPEPSVFVPPPERGGAMDGDEVVVGWWPGERGPEGSVRSIVKRHRTRVTGVLKRHGKRVFIEPDDPRVLGEADVLGSTGAASGLVIVGSIVDYPDPWNSSFTVKVERTLGEPGSLATEEARILVEQGIDPELPKKVLKAAESVPTRVLKSDRENRADLRGLDFMTIDPPDARDFDDAVCVEVLGKDPRRARMRVHVAVADVSHYVTEKDIFDEEAVYRCFSTYLPSGVIPMLPFPLSANICSLVPKKERCAMVVSFDLDANGKMGEGEVAAAVIRSRARLTYDQVASELGGKGPSKLDAEQRARVKNLRIASDRLHAARRRRGSIELNLPEIKVLLDDDDRERVRDVVPARKTPEMTRAYNLIEELMVAANEATGKLAVKHRLPVVYRVHDRPEEERIERFCAVAELLGVDVDGSKLDSPKGFQALLKRIENHPRKGPLHSLLLRTMSQAEYSTHNVGHFALASSAYLHFTSPIRRYPDLINHRVFKAFIGRRGGSAGPAPIPKMPAMKDSTERAQRSSERERMVVQAERDAKSLLCAAFMRDRIGDRFEGTVSGMSRSGVFVTLDAPMVDGMVRRSAIERDAREAFDLDEFGASMVGTKSGRRITVGDRVIIEVLAVSLARRQIDFSLMGHLS